MMIKKKSKKKKIEASTDFFCREKIERVDYRDVEILKKFLNPQGRIVSQTLSRLLRKNQRKVTLAIKRARQMALLPYEIVEQSVLGFSYHRKKTTTNNKKEKLDGEVL